MTNSNLNLCDYLDFTAAIINGQVQLSLFDKTAAFSFKVNKVTEATSNVHSRIGYNNFYSQLIRIGRICNNFGSFKQRVLFLYSAFQIRVTTQVS